MDRRNFIKSATVLASAIPFSMSYAASEPPAQVGIHAFSKAFHFLNYEELASLFKEAGLDGIDMTVRAEGHVLPENVERDLPKAIQAAGKHGLSVPSIVTDIVDADDPFTERILKTAASNGVKYYRLGNLMYDYQQPVQTNLQRIESKLKRIAGLNMKYGICGGYQNHVYFGTRFGSNPWEIWSVIRNIDQRGLCCIYDIYHGVAEGTLSWPSALRLISPYTGMLYVKDFRFTSSPKSKIELESCPLGTGVVDFKAFFRLCRELGINHLPISLHFEYPLFTGDEIHLSAIDKYKRALNILKRDADQLKRLLLDTKS
jgi:sugar phosphate isomerase/epimerase